ncbi:MAG: LLM class flavin-dependent oxidoreductase [SAR202 cluster bacterium]|jgi:alkanesulfonate monooxygenase SsuD/methylene tetrahydromethanopterin reductase-like flavin-dependent oxidoreductase (luciferase family)|nr:LLM class flavin-dependent oxidoreductase [SAR202 cluster bacterium]MDP6301995.1 LLM class flavin-dependent oxidoreductase [SAR202 cluster bacterium]MDP7103384.1 LLM class flavin-dependent oxidoreductase [SAR202 cluster bacterium]MDP7223752.1 LLM class flavin-dependent oxidoreductase [SAR202 cluster bacterium]MDP7415010.1 LLM class flavin-dependent oxidoreductase [SAR202 cluster bacterium]
MKFGVQVGCYRTTWDDISASIEAMEAGRWDSLWFADHFLPPSPGSPGGDREQELGTAFEGYTLTAVAAGMTSKLVLGHLVLGNTYRNPALVAKMAATLDQASKGRFVLALGAAWFQREHEAFGWDFPPMKERSDRFEEACELIRKLFTAEGVVSYNGKYYQLDEAPLSPGSYQEPHIPILIGGTGEQRTMRTLAKYGDIFNLDGWSGRGMSMQLYQHKMGVLERHCEAVGRDPSEIKRTLLAPILITDDQDEAERFNIARGYRAMDRLHGNYAGPLMEPKDSGSLAGPRDYIIERIGEFADAGVDEIMFGGIPTGDVEAFQRVEEEIVAAFD